MVQLTRNPMGDWLRDTLESRLHSPESPTSDSPPSPLGIYPSGMNNDVARSVSTKKTSDACTSSRSLRNDGPVVRKVR